MGIKNFKIKKIDIYLKNFFQIFKFLTRNKSEKKIIEIQNIMSSFNLNSIKKKLNKIEEIYLKNSENPFITSAVAFQQIDKDKNPEKGFKNGGLSVVIKKLGRKEKIKDFKWNYVPICRVTGSFGNYWTLFSYLMSMNNVEKIKNKPNLILKPKQKLTNSELFKYFLPFLNVIEDEKLFINQSF